MKTNIKKFLTSLLAFVFLISSSCFVFSGCGKKTTKPEEKYKPTADDVAVAQTFSLISKTIEGVSGYSIFRYKLNEEEVVIPETYMGKPVLEIANSAFYQKNITSLTIGSNVKRIGERCFYFCNNLVEVVFAKNSKNVNNLNLINDYAFKETSISSIEIPKNVKEIRHSAFEWCKSLATLTFETGSKLETIFPNAFCETAITSVTIPASVKTIEHLAFGKCENLATLIFEENSQIEYLSGFQYIAISSVTIPASVKTLYSSFSSCLQLETVTFEEGSQVETIDGIVFGCSGEFQQGNKLTSIFIPSSVKTLSGAVFQLCKQMTTLIFEANSQLTSISDYDDYSTMFAYCELFSELVVLGDIANVANICNQIKNAFLIGGFFPDISNIALKVEPEIVASVQELNITNDWGFGSVVAN